MKTLLSCLFIKNIWLKVMRRYLIVLVYPVAQFLFAQEVLLPTTYLPEVDAYGEISYSPPLLSNSSASNRCDDSLVIEGKAFNGIGLAFNSILIDGNSLPDTKMHFCPNTPEGSCILAVTHITFTDLREWLRSFPTESFYVGINVIKFDGKNHWICSLSAKVFWPYATTSLSWIGTDLSPAASLVLKHQPEGSASGYQEFQFYQWQEEPEPGLPSALFEFDLSVLAQGAVQNISILFTVSKAKLRRPEDHIKSFIVNVDPELMALDSVVHILVHPVLRGTQIKAHYPDACFTGSSSLVGVNRFESLNGFRKVLYPKPMIHFQWRNVAFPETIGPVSAISSEGEALNVLCHEDSQDRMNCRIDMSGVPPLQWIEILGGDLPDAQCDRLHDLGVFWQLGELSRTADKQGVVHVAWQEAAIKAEAYQVSIACTHNEQVKIVSVNFLESNQTQKEQGCRFYCSISVTPFYKGELQPKYKKNYDSEPEPDFCILLPSTTTRTMNYQTVYDADLSSSSTMNSQTVYEADSTTISTMNSQTVYEADSTTISTISTMNSQTVYDAYSSPSSTPHPINNSATSRTAPFLLLPWVTALYAIYLR